MNEKRLGTFQTLEISHAVEFGIYLHTGEGDERILLPIKEEPREWEVGDKLEVFVYLDSDDRIIATRRTPLIEVGKFARLKVSDLDPARGAFMDWGLEKDLLVPFREQAERMEAGQSYIVRAYVDEQSKRIVGSSRINRFLSEHPPSLAQGQQVSALIHRKMKIGYRVIVDHAYHGMIYENEIFADVRIGEEKTAFVKSVRPDGRLDLSLQPLGYQKVVSEEEVILSLLTSNGGNLPFGDKSSPESIQKAFGLSKKTFKATLGALYRKNLISIGPHQISAR